VIIRGSIAIVQNQAGNFVLASAMKKMLLFSKAFYIYCTLVYSS